MPNWTTIEGNIATPAGFAASATYAGFKQDGGALDLALIYSEGVRTAAAGVFTTNRVVAAPVVLSRRHLAQSRGRARAIVVNSGNANACTGRAGMRAAEETARTAAELVGVSAKQVLVASTGVIGAPFEPAQITNQLPRLLATLADGNGGNVARAIMTTDTVQKSFVLRAKLSGRWVHLAGIAKGSGMIHPRMATTLCFVTTDAGIPPRDLHSMLRVAASLSFNRITVDGDTSTNDMMLAMASGLSGARVQSGSRDAAHFQAGLTQLATVLAQKVARDGEGATKFITVKVRGARTPGDADRAARAIANSPLVKTAIAGCDANWGRIICAAGYSGAQFDPRRVEIRVNRLLLCRNGAGVKFDETAARRELGKKDLALTVHLHGGSARAQMWTCDLTRGYIDINASYRS